jgi:putative transposase
MRGHYVQVTPRQAELARQVVRKRSQNTVKTQRRIARLHARIANIRADALHKLTTDLVERFDIIAIEGLHVAGMLKNHQLARAMAPIWVLANFAVSWSIKRRSEARRSWW